MLKSILVVCKNWSNKVLSSTVMLSMVKVSEAEVRGKHKKTENKTIARLNMFSEFDGMIKVKKFKKLIMEQPLLIAIKNDNVEIFKNIKFDLDWFRQNCIPEGKPQDSMFHHLVEKKSFQCLDYLLNDVYLTLYEIQEKIQKLLWTPLLTSKSETLFLYSFKSKETQPVLFKIITEFFKKHWIYSLTTLLNGYPNDKPLESKTLQTFLEYYKVDPNFELNNQLLIFHAFENGNEVFFKYLLDNGVNLKVRNTYDVTPVHIAFSHGIVLDLDYIVSNLDYFQHPTKINFSFTLLECIVSGIAFNRGINIMEIISKLQLPIDTPISINHLISAIASMNSMTSDLPLVMDKIQCLPTLQYSGVLGYTSWKKQWWQSQRENAVPYAYRSFEHYGFKQQDNSQIWIRKK
eukprot:TRINITY_DN11257_c0_g1_i1.p1 TRINITY_DN11257_c0_g1~~TRINITY_DN11257_c0_g1_i1.p1  ORF type:complete len:425 (-),score=94.67 TRINITY_DN11257_c0_g1_i1:85-1296(-)